MRFSHDVVVCPSCGCTSFICECGRSVEITKMVDVLHLGECPACGWVEDDCLEHSSPELRVERSFMGRLVDWLMERGTHS